MPVSPRSTLLAAAFVALGVVTEAALAIDFTLKGLDGDTHSLSDYRGKWVVVNYWATWCPPCLEEMPELDLFHNAHKDEAVVLGVNFEDVGEAQLEAFVEKHFIGYPILLSKPDARSPLGPIPGLPTTYIVSPEGEVVARQIGPLTKEMLEDFLARQKAERDQGDGSNAS